jgi:pyruvate dehydrogenase E1 component alpha subunit
MSRLSPGAPPLEKEAAVLLLREMLRIRRFEEECAKLYSATKIRGFLHLYIGEEAVAAGVMPALAPEDAVVATYREHGHALARGVPAAAVMAEMFGKAEGCSRGRGGSMHLFDAKARFYGGNAIVGGGLPLAVGLALADKYLRRERVTACFFGEGAVAEGEFHESLNLAALWRLPVLFCCENNLYAMGTALGRSESETDLCLKAASYEIPAWPVDGMDVLAVRSAAQRAAVAFAEAGTWEAVADLERFVYSEGRP